MHLTDRVALVTGASRGIGLAIASQLRDAGCHLVLTARSVEALQAISRPGDLVVPGDLLDASFREHLISQALATHGRIDLLVNNAGVGHYRTSIEADSAEIRTLWELNFFAPLELARLVVPGMLEQPLLPDAQERGMVVNISSVAGMVTLPWFSMYSASKFALCSWTEGLRMEYGSRGIRTLAVCPGYVKTEFQESVLSGTPPPALAKSKERFAITPEACAREVLRGIRRNKRIVVTPRSNWALVAAARWMPVLLEKRLARISGTG
jgi:short-subunit dehydrogenase